MPPESSSKGCWLWLRGLTREVEHWGSFRQDFREFFPNDQMICLDLPGAGVKRNLNSPLTIGAYTDALRVELKAHIDDLPVFGLGLSMGGMVLLDWVRRYPEDFRGVVLLNTSAANLGRPWQRANWRLAKIVCEVLVNRSPQHIEQSILDLVTNDSEKRKKALVEWVEIRRQRPPTISNMIRQIIAAATFQIEFPEITTPTLILSSAHDRLVSSKLSALLAEKLVSAKHVVHSRAGHDLPIDDPKWIIKHVSDWLSR